MKKKGIATSELISIIIVVIVIVIGIAIIALSGRGTVRIFDFIFGR